MDYTLGYYLLPHPPIIIPNIGRGEEEKIINTVNAMKKVSQEIKDKQPETVVIITPHGLMFRDAIAISNEENIEGNLRKFRSDLSFNKQIDIPLTKEIIKQANKLNIDTIGIDSNILKKYNHEYELDHGTMVPLYFIDQEYQNYKLVHITYSPFTNIDLYQFGIILKQSINKLKRNTVILASGDLSHCLIKDGPYPYSPKGKIFDEAFISHLQKGELLNVMQMDPKLIHEAKECGYPSTIILLGAINSEFTADILSYEGPFGVGYAVVRFEPKKCEVNYLDLLKKDQKKKINNNPNDYVKLARSSLEYYFKNQKVIDVPKDLPSELLNNRAGVFVSLKKQGYLRGCIGTFLPTTNSVAEEIIRNAIEAALSDPRFSPLRSSELNEISISVDVLSKPERATINELDPKIYGVIVTLGHKRGLLLPNLEGINTVDEQLKAVCEKANIPINSDFKIQRFLVERYYEGKDD